MIASSLINLVCVYDNQRAHQRLGKTQGWALSGGNSDSLYHNMTLEFRCFLFCFVLLMATDDNNRKHQ